MKKTLLELSLLVLLLIVLSTLTLFHFYPQNLLTRSFRPACLKQSWCRVALRLKGIGDARYVFAAGASPLAVAVWTAPGTTPSPLFESGLRNLVKDTLGKEITLTIKTLPVAPAQSQSDQALREILTATKPAGTPTLRVIFVPRSADIPSNAGAVLSPDAIFLFTATMNDLSSRDTIRAKLEQSTLMHEWGHLLGLNHIDQDGCIMNEKVEVFENRRFQESNLPTRYCPEELYQLHLLLR